ncbi:MAG: tetratricopeptide repeat protein [Gemmatimonadaceae bacterium]
MGYRRTLFDRFGPRAADYFNAFRGAFIAAALFGVYGGARYAVEHDFNPVLGGLLGFLIVGFVSWFGIIGVSAAAGGSFSAFIQPQGTYQETFSYEDSLLARGNHAAAIAAFERHVAEGTGGVPVVIRTADLQAKHGNPKRAAELYRDAQQKPSISPESHMYATNRLIDLYMGPLSNAEAAVSELRRLIATHPSSDAAKHARTALVNLKRQLRSGSTD